MIFLPRQARDKHRESTQKKSGVFSQNLNTGGSYQNYWGSWIMDWFGKETRLFAPFIYTNDDFTKTGSGQT